MPSSLNKVQKRISKKRSATKGKSRSLNALHEDSRDAQRIRRAAARDEKVVRGERERERRNDRFLKRLAHIHAAVNLADQLSNNATTAPPLPATTDDQMTDAPTQTGTHFTAEGLHTLIHSFLSSHDRALKEIESERRPGRPKSREHERLEAAKTADEQEYESGFWMVDLRTADKVKGFKRWNGLWEALGNHEFVRVRKRREGQGWEETVVGSRFPPTGRD
ncbi:hypothetical protein B9Z65_348 [Elsinoe australis]|uniref:Uncharacterized protein n=1 Tax=Elsinoe australis TaxID=40998 RepID=A0A2P7ZQC1_9PEZI|nr:hypothetical protein B9Z65_348 [Elsinoe australis]